MGADNCLGGRIVRATTVGKPDTSGRIVVSRRTIERDREDEVPEAADIGECSNSSRAVIQINADEKFVVDSAEKKLEELAGVIAEGQEDICLMFEEEEGLEDKIHDTLKRHVSFWKESGASNFAISVVENGYVPQMWENPQEYEEKNNGSYREEKSWANEAVASLVRARLVREAWCV